jgi:hypothetical protein
MTISAAGQGTNAALAEREAWDTYRDSLRDLEGNDYEEAERISWERLQRALSDLEGVPDGAE